MYTILVVDDEKELCSRLVTLLTSHGYHVEKAENGQEAAEKLAVKQYPLVISDVKMPQMDGKELLRFVRDNGFSTAVILVTAHGNIRDAIDVTRQGAFEYLQKPISEDQLLETVQKAERAHNMLYKISNSAPVMYSDKKGEGLECIGESRGMKRIFQLVERLGEVKTSVLIRGENGTGKELVARGIHFNSPRKNHPFVAVNCAAIPENLIESELFGHEKGAFTGADSRKIGKFQYAAGGTLFLDEIGDMSPTVQVKLLRVLQDHSFIPVGSNREVKADVRVVAATNRNLEKMIEEDKFREDLFYRLNVMPIFLPPLRERTVDIPNLVHHFIDKFNREHGSRIRGVTADALALLEAYKWPGNIRELENAVEHAFILENSDQITIFSLPEYIRNKVKHIPRAPKPSEVSSSRFFADLDWEKGKETFEREFIVQALKSNDGRINLTAELANIPKNTLLRKIKKYNINPKEYGAAQSGMV